MKKYTSMIILLIFIFSGISTATIKSDNYTNFKIKNFSISINEPTIIDNDDYIRVDLEESSTYLFKSGEPIIPVFTKVITFPAGTKIKNIDLKLSNNRFINLNKQIQPAPKPFSIEKKQQTDTINFKNKAIYENNELYPPIDFQYKLGSGIDGYEHVIFLTLDCYCLKYSPVNNMIYFSEDIEINILYEEPSIPISYDEKYDMVIITPNEFSEGLQPLIEHKNDIGIETSIKTTEEIINEFEGRDEIEQIKYFIKYAIENWNIKYVLLVGGSEQLPARYTNIYYEDEYKDHWNFLSDLYYADIYNAQMEFSSWDTNGNNEFAEYDWNGNFDELDLYPDVYIGRLACINDEELNICINKIITYETQEAYLQDWFKNLVLIGGDSLPGDVEKIDEGEYVNEHVIDILQGFDPIKIWASNGELNDAENINDAINQGAGFVFFNGHGNLGVWATHPHERDNWIPPGSYTNNHIYSLTNENKLPIVISDACYHCTYNMRPDCFGWAFLINPNGGAIAFLGGTDVDLSYAGVDIITKGVEKLCLELSTHYMTGTTTFGELWGKSLTSYMSTATMDQIDYITVEENQPFGDPSLKIKKNYSPNQPEIPTGPNTGLPNVEYTYSTFTTEPDEDIIYFMFDWGDESNSEWLGPYESDQECSTAHSWQNQGNYNVRVKAKDSGNEESLWSDPLPVTIPKNKTYLYFYQMIQENYPIIYRIINYLLDS